MNEIVEEVKKHPYLIGGAAIAVVGLFLVIQSRNASAASAAAPDDTAAELSYAAQTQQIQAQQGTQSLQAQYGLQLATIQANAQQSQDNTAATVAEYTVQQQSNTANLGIAANLQGLETQSAVQIEGIQATLQGIQSNNATSLGLAQINADEATQIANLTSGVETTISNNQTTLGLAQTAGSVNIADTASNNAVKIATQQSNSNLLGGIIGLAGAFL